MALAAVEAATIGAIRRCGRRPGAIGEDDGGYFESLEDHQRDDRHGLRVALGRVAAARRRPGRRSEPPRNSGRTQ